PTESRRVRNTSQSCPGYDPDESETRLNRVRALYCDMGDVPERRRSPSLRIFAGSNKGAEQSSLTQTTAAARLDLTPKTSGAGAGPSRLSHQSTRLYEEG